MSSIAEILSNLKYSRSLITEVIEGLSKRELTERSTNCHDGLTIKELLAHFTGWDRRSITILTYVLAADTGKAKGVDPVKFDRQNVAQWAERSLDAVRAAFETTRAELLTVIQRMDHVDLDLRRQWGDRVITIRSYILDETLEHERRHALELKAWRADLEAQVDPAMLKADLVQARSQFATVIHAFSETDAVTPNSIGNWSIKDMVGHVVDWEWRMLKAMRHIHDASEPSPPSFGEQEEEGTWNEIMVKARRSVSWQQTMADFAAARDAVDDFLSDLTLKDWIQRGPYPWYNDQGMLAELVYHLTVHFDEHRTQLEAYQAV